MKPILLLLLASAFGSPASAATTLFGPTTYRGALDSPFLRGIPAGTKISAAVPAAGLATLTRTQNATATQSGALLIHYIRTASAGDLMRDPSAVDFPPCFAGITDGWIGPGGCFVDFPASLNGPGPGWAFDLPGQAQRLPG